MSFLERIGRRHAVLGAGIAAALAAVVLAVNVGGSGGGAKMCLATDFTFVAGATRKCYAKKDLNGLKGAQVLDSEGAPATVQLSNAAGATEDVLTCGAYEEKRAQGWFAESTRETARESFFIRACGVLNALAKARAPRVAAFRNRALEQLDVVALASSGSFSFGEPASNAAVSVKKEDEGRWQIAAGGTVIRLQELAYADFNGDGSGEVLAYVEVSPEGGTAAADAVGIVTKDSRGIRFVPVGESAASRGA